MATKYYGIKDNWTDDDVSNVIEVASEDGSVSSVKVNGVEYGGGGGGDTVWNITLINNSAAADYIGLYPDNSDPVLSYYFKIGSTFFFSPNPNYKTSAGATSIYELHVLDSSLTSLEAWAMSGAITSVTGSATLDHGNAVITGDCTITITD